MRNLNLSKVNVVIEPPYTATSPIRFRRYNILHLDNPREVNLSISPYFFNLDLYTTSTNLIYSQWYFIYGDRYQITFAVFVGDYPYDVAKYRYEKFLELLPMSISAVANGDKGLLEANPSLYEAPVYVRFISSYPQFNKIVPYKFIKDYIDDRVDVSVKSK